MEKLYRFEDEHELYDFYEVLDECGLREEEFFGNETLECKECGVTYPDMLAYVDCDDNLLCSKECVLDHFGLIETEDLGEDDYDERMREYNAQRL